MMRAQGNAATERLVSGVTEQTIWFLGTEIGLNAVVAQRPESLEPPLLTSAMAFTGAMDGYITLTAEHRTVAEILRRILGDSIPPEELSPMLEDTLCEVLNVIVGSTTRLLDFGGLRIRIESPAPICAMPPTECAHSSSQGRQRSVIRTDCGLLMIDCWARVNTPDTQPA